MKAVLKVLAGLGALVVIVIVAGGALLGAFFDPNEYKPEIETAALEKGGVELEINGDIGWSVFPWLGLEVNQIAVKFPDQADLAELKQAQLSVRLPALLSGQVEMQSIVIDGLNLNLVKEADGKSNWAAEVSQSSAADTETTASSESSSSGGASIGLNIDSIQISNGNISYTDKSTGSSAKISDFAMTSGQIVTQAFFPAELSFSVAQSANGEEQIKAQANLSAEFFIDLENQLYKIKGLNSALTLSGQPFAGNSVALTTAADIEADLAKQSAKLDNLKLSVADLKAQGNIAVKQFSAPEISGKLQVAAFDLNKLLTSLGQAKVETTDSNALSAISFDAELGGPANTATAKAITLKLDDTTFNGSAAYDLNSGRISVNLQGDKLNADRYTPPATEQTASADSNAAGASDTGSVTKGYPKDPILPVEALRSLNLDAKFGLKALQVSGLDVSNIALQVDANKGLIKASKINADLYQGTVRNVVTVDVRKDTPVITSKKNIKGIQIGNMLKAVAEVDQLTGAFNSSSNLTLRGNSVHDFVNSVTGTASVNMNDGELKGIDLAQTVCQGMNNISSLGVNTQQVDRSTPFANLGASTRIKNGVVNNRDLRAALDAMVLSGKGSVNLPKQLLDYRLGFQVEKNLFKETCSFPDALEGVEIPVDCKGAFDTPPTQLCKPDFGFVEDAIKKRLKDKVESKAKEKVEEKLKGKLGDKLRGLF